ncbi:uncharacterized protein [Rutidosis leptorrhynchoides]|uniref:uncharacterized protein n=1 Tax=Rutidosis leptorrhynchoides TaxID=125765 RepID=UPI003A99E86C
MSNFTFISDRQKGLIEAIKKHFPVAEHRYCLRHLQQNMRERWSGTAYKNHLWNCATALTVPEFNEAMQKLKSFSEPCYVWLSKVPPKHWARSHFTGRAKSDILLNNICEVFNRWLVDARDKPIITMLEYIREYCMKRIVNVKNVIAKCEGPLSLTATKMFDKIKKDASKYKVLWNCGNKYQTCGCKRWQLTGMACKHAVATFWNMEKHNQDVGVPEVWVDPVYWLETWVNTYNHVINPVNGRSKWVKSTETTTLTAPIRRPKSGRPKKNRRKEMEERQSLSQGGKLTRAGKSLTCGKCKKYGHNRRTCDLKDGASSTKPAKKKTKDGASSSKSAKRKNTDGASKANKRKKVDCEAGST